MGCAAPFPVGRWLAPAKALGALRADPPVVYQLLIEVRRPVRIRIATLGEVVLPPGRYVYSGSARHASRARLARHLRKRKCRHWHIDHLLAQPSARVIAVRVWPWQPRRECRMNLRLLRQGRAEPVAPGFGSSDCEHGCPAHLLLIPPASRGSGDAFARLLLLPSRPLRMTEFPRPSARGAEPLLEVGHGLYHRLPSTPLPRRA